MTDNPFSILESWASILEGLRCKPRILCVTDSLFFGPFAFGLSEAIQVVRDAATIDRPLEVVTAHMGEDGFADVSNFLFEDEHTVDGEVRTIHDYDQLWLFAANVASGPGSSISKDARNAITAFMDAGGGVLAMGDHANLGAWMCGDIPRVRLMRHWYVPPAPLGVGPGRIDTNVPSPGADPQFDLQSDAIPQRIYPTWYGDPFFGVPHPLLSFEGGAITHLPDHPHEGRCVVPETLDPDEWPKDPVEEGVRIGPELVAHAVSAGPGFAPGKASVEASLFGVIGAFDGHRGGIGRIVVDSTWHHWLNINLNGTGATELSGGVPTKGLYVDGAPTPEYLQIQAYYRNIASWLERKNTKDCWLALRIPILRWEWPLRQEIGEDDEPPLAEHVRIGKLVVQTLERRYGAALPAELVCFLLDEAAIDPDLRAMLDPWREDDPLELPAMFDQSAIPAAILGGATVAFARSVPDDPTAGFDALRKMMRKKKKGKALVIEPLLAVLRKGVRRALSQIGVELEDESPGIERLAECIEDCDL